jgi:hypothetical protein
VRPGRPDGQDITRRTTACNALTELSTAAHRAATAALTGAGSGQMREHVAMLNAMLSAIGILPGIAAPRKERGDRA